MLEVHDKEVVKCQDVKKFLDNLDKKINSEKFAQSKHNYL